MQDTTDKASSHSEESPKQRSIKVMAKGIDTAISDNKQ